MPLDANQVIDTIVDALQAASREEQWPDRMQLPDVVDELSRWLEDERQWLSARPRNWASLLDDLLAALNALATETQKATGCPELRGELRACRALLARDETRADPALRRRLRRLVSTVRERFLSVDARLAAWTDLTLRSPNPRAADQAARQLIALGSWFGHDADGLRHVLDAELRGTVAKLEDQELRPPEERLAAAEDVLRTDPRRGHMIVWFRYIFARVTPGWFDLGSAVRIYRDEWLRSALDHTPDHQDLPPEAHSSLGTLQIFCEKRPNEAQDPRERPVAYVRIDLGDESASGAVGIARDTAEAIASLGVLYGADPAIWRLDDSYVAFADGGHGGMSSSPSVVEAPTFRERSAVAEDRTAENLIEMADRLGPHLPVRDPSLHAAVTLLGWLRDARNSRTPLQLVLFDRVIEAASGWAGVNSMSRFIHDALIPWWTYNRIRNAIHNAGRSAVWAGSMARYPEGSPERTAWQEIRDHPPLEISETGERSQLSLRGVLTETQWLLERVPVDSEAHGLLTELALRTSSGASTASWWTELSDQAERMEARRARTRNALIHGGPLAPATVESVAAFAEYLAGEALAACVEGRLLGADLIDYFLSRNRRMAVVRARLVAGDAPADALFWED